MILFETVNTLQKVRAKITGRKIKAPSSFASKGERCVAGVLAKHGIEYKPQHPLGYMHVDFAVVHQGKLFFIEYDGLQHYRPVRHFGGRKAFAVQKVRDTLEKWECRDRKIPLLRIRYDVPFEMIEPMIMDFLGIRE